MTNQHLTAKGETAMGNFGKLKKMSDLPKERILLQLIRQAAKLNESGIKIPRKRKITATLSLKIPGYFRKAIRENKKASKTFEALSYSNKKDYVDWVIEAKTEETRQKRITISVDWMAEGKSRNWKYEKSKLI